MLPPPLPHVHLQPGSDLYATFCLSSLIFLSLSITIYTLPPSCAFVMKSGNLNFLEPSGTLLACNGTDLPITIYKDIRPTALCWHNKRFPNLITTLRYFLSPINWWVNMKGHSEKAPFASLWNVSRSIIVSSCRPRLANCNHLSLVIRQSTA